MDDFGAVSLRHQMPSYISFFVREFLHAITQAQFVLIQLFINIIHSRIFFLCNSLLLVPTATGRRVTSSSIAEWCDWEQIVKAPLLVEGDFHKHLQCKKLINNNTYSWSSSSTFLNSSLEELRSDEDDESIHTVARSCEMGSSSTLRHFLRHPHPVLMHHVSS